MNHQEAALKRYLLNCKLLNEIFYADEKELIFEERIEKLEKFSEKLDELINKETKEQEIPKKTTKTRPKGTNISFIKL